MFTTSRDRLAIFLKNWNEAFEFPGLRATAPSENSLLFEGSGGAVGDLERMAGNARKGAASPTGMKWASEVWQDPKVTPSPSEPVEVELASGRLLVAYWSAINQAFVQLDDPERRLIHEVVRWRATV
jgi:hypothetical protein